MLYYNKRTRFKLTSTESTPDTSKNFIGHGFEIDEQMDRVTQLQFLHFNN